MINVIKHTEEDYSVNISGNGQMMLDEYMAAVVGVFSVLSEYGNYAPKEVAELITAKTIEGLKYGVGESEGNA